MCVDFGELEEMVFELLIYVCLEYGNVGSYWEIVDVVSWLDSVVVDVVLEVEVVGVICEISVCQVEQICIEFCFMVCVVINLLCNVICYVYLCVEIVFFD